MGLTLGDVLAIVFGSLLFLLLLGYLLYSYVFKSRQDITIEQMEECIRRNPSCRDKIKNFIQRSEQDDMRQMYNDSTSTMGGNDYTSTMGGNDYTSTMGGNPNIESYQPPPPNQERDVVLDQVDNSVRMREIKTPVR